MFRRTQYHLSLAAGATCCLVLAGSLTASAAERVVWLTGPALERHLDQKTSLDWSSVALWPALANLAELHRVAILLDRRVDPGQEVTLSVTDAPLREVLQQIAVSGGLTLSLFGPVAYLGPPVSAGRLRTLAALRREDIDPLPKESRTRLLKKRAWAWADLDAPRDLLDLLAKEGRLEFPDADQLPHDLWAGADLPPLTLIERLTLILNQFDLTFQVDEGGHQLRFVPVPEKVTVERTFPGGANAQKLADEWRGLLPDCRIVLADGKIVVRGRVEDLERIAVGQEGTATRTTVTGPKTTTYRLTVKNQTLGALLKALENKLKMDIQVDEAGLQRAGVMLNQKVSFTVKDVSLDELFQAALGPLGLTFRRGEKVIEVFPAEKP